MKTVSSQGSPSRLQVVLARLRLGPAGIVAGLAFLLYMSTLAPTVATLFDDSLEFHVVIPLLGVPHPPGYPLYTLVGKLWTLLLPLRDPAWRLNVLSALFAALALGILYRLTYMLVPRHRAVAPAVITLALAPTFWSQATIAEVYALHMFFMAAILVLLLRLDKQPSPRTLYFLAITVGFSLTHHRMTLLLLPIIAYVFWARRRRLGFSLGTWFKASLLIGVPQLLYLYIPLVGARVGSLDGTYVNTLSGFLDWVQARAYRVFITDNPFNVHREPGDYVRLYTEEMGTLALALAVLGISRIRRGTPYWLALAIGVVVQVLFAVNYKVADIQVFFLPVFLLSVPFIAAALSDVWDAGTGFLQGRLPAKPVSIIGSVLLAALVLVQPVARTRAHWDALNRADDWGIYDWGADMVTQPLPEGSVIVGILGETTLVRYFRNVLGMRPDLHVVPADREDARHAAIQEAMAAGRAVFITRPLAGAPERYSLDAQGPLVRVWSKGQDDRPQPSHAEEVSFIPGVRLAGYDLVPRQTHSGPVVRVVLYWDVDAPLAEDYKVSARLLRADGSVAVAVDDVPVHNTYPTRYWVPGERVVDVYDLPRSEVNVSRVLIILYRAADGSEVGRTEVPLDIPAQGF